MFRLTFGWRFGGCLTLFAKTVSERYSGNRYKLTGIERYEKRHSMGINYFSHTGTALVVSAYRSAAY
jgi:hypothetical protein